MASNQSEIVGKTLAAQVADKLRDDILGRRIQPGAHITTREIAEKYGVSNVPVREAFSMLCGENLLENLPYKGAVVKTVTPEYIMEIIDLLYALEMLLIELSMEKGYKPATLNKLEEINEQMAKLTDDVTTWPEKRLDLNISFHMTLFSPCKGHMAYDLYEKNLRYISIIRKYYQIDLDRSKQTIVEHREIIKAIKDNDLEEALEATRKHSKSSKKTETKFINDKDL